MTEVTSRHHNTPSAFEIRFKGSDSDPEVVDLTHDRLPPTERHIPDPFRKRDKIPRNSGTFSLAHVAPDRASNNLQNGTKSNVKGNYVSRIPQRRTGNSKDSEPEHSAMSNGVTADKPLHMRSRPSYKKRPVSESSNSDDDRWDGHTEMRKPAKNFKGAPKNKSSRKNRLSNKRQAKATHNQIESDSFTQFNYSEGLYTPPATPPGSPSSIHTSKPNSTSSRKNSNAADPATLSDSSSAYTSSTTTTTSVTVPSSSTPPSDPPLPTSPPTTTPLSATVEVSLTESPPSKSPIPHDEIIIPTVAKRLKNNGQFSESSESNRRRDTGYTDITDQVENLFEPKYPTFPRRKTSQSSTPRTRPRQNSVTSRKRSGSQSGITRPKRSNTAPLPIPTPIIDDAPAIPIESTLEAGSTTTESPESRKKARREEWVMVMKDDNDAEDHSEQSDPTATQPLERNSTENDVKNQPSPPLVANKNPKIVVTPAGHDERPVTLDLQSVPTSASKESKPSKKTKKKKDKKRKNQTVDGDDEFVKQSKCCCIIC